MKKSGTPKRAPKFSGLLEDEGVARWYSNVARGSAVTADVYLRRLANFCSDANLTPQMLRKMDEKELYDIVLDTVSKLEKKGYAGSYIQSTIKAVKSWL